ncbi:hypothetical protein D3C76_942590 [compost metagenome]
MAHSFIARALQVVSKQTLAVLKIYLAALVQDLVVVNSNTRDNSVVIAVKINMPA